MCNGAGTSTNTWGEMQYQDMACSGVYQQQSRS